MERDRHESDREPKRAAREACPPDRPATGAEPPGCSFMGLQDVLGNRGVARRLQAKLAVSQPGDPLEAEADRIADRVVSGATVSPPCTCEGKGPCPKCQAEQQAMVHRKASADAGGPSWLGSAPAPKGGRPLEPPVRSFMESRFRHDFGGVRVHTDAEASRSARQIDALAYTVGQDVVFREGHYAPGSTEGRRLLAHELAHVVQQGMDESMIYRIAVPQGGNPSSTPSELPATPDAPAQPVGPVAPGQHDGQAVGIWGGWWWNTQLTAGTRGARDFDNQAAAIASAAMYPAGSAVYKEDDRFVIYPLKYTAAHSFTYENVRKNSSTQECNLKTPGVLAITTADGVPILPQQMKGGDDKPPAGDDSPMEAQDKLHEGADPFAAHKEVFGKGLGGLTQRGGFLAEFSRAMRDVAISALDKSQKDAEKKQSEMKGGALPKEDAKAIRETAEKLQAIREKSRHDTEPFETKADFLVPEAEIKRRHTSWAARKAAYKKEEDEILLRYPLLTHIDADDFLKMSEKDQAKALGGQAGEVLSNIKETRNDVLTGELDLWTVPQIVRATQAGLGIIDDGRKAWIEEFVAQKKKDDADTKRHITFFQIFFSFAAMLGGPVGAAFAVGALAVSLGDALIITNELMVERSAADTDIDPKKALVPADLTGQYQNMVIAWMYVGLTLAEAVYWVRSIKSGALTVEEAAAAASKGKNIDKAALEAAAEGAEKARKVGRVIVVTAEQKIVRFALQEEALNSYAATVHDVVYNTPSGMKQVEVSLFQNAQTGEYAVIRSETDEHVGEAAKELGAGWTCPNHFHPMRMGFSSRFPSWPDFKIIERRAMASGKPVSSMITAHYEEAFVVTEYTYVPGASEPYVVEFVNLKGALETKSFQDLQKFLKFASEIR